MVQPETSGPQPVHRTSRWVAFFLPLLLLLTAFPHQAIVAAPIQQAHPTLLQLPLQTARVPLMSVPDSQTVFALPVCPPTINFGQTIECSISAIAELDTYRFMATGNDIIQVRVTRISDTLRPRARVINPNGTQVCGDDSGNPVTWIDRCQITSTGTYSLRVDDTFTSNKGGYTVYIQRLNNPGNAQSIAFGETIVGGIERLADAQTYTFVASVDDTVQFRMTRTSQTLRPRMRVFNPSGDQVCYDDSGNPISWIDKCRLATTGTYTLLVDDTFSGNIGNYTLYLQRINNPGDRIVLGDFGHTLTGKIERIADAKTYTFVAKVDDVIQVRMTRTSDTLRPRVRIFFSNGAEVCSDDSGNPVAWIDRCKLASAGTYTMMLDDTFSSNIGQYTLYIQRLNNPGVTQRIDFEQVLAGSIDRLADAKTYTFIGSLDDKIQVRMTRTSDELRPRVRIFNPAGIGVCAADSGNPTTLISNCTLSTSGLYTMLVDDTFTSQIGNYNLSLQCMSSNCAALSLPVCGVQPNGLDTCALQPGDILIQKSNSLINTVFMGIGGTYFTHAAIYVGDGRIVEATGPFFSPADQVIEQSVNGWGSPAIYDWVVIRPETTDDIKQTAVDFAKAKANATAPIVTYSISANRDSQQDTYCSLLVWQAYMQSGLDLEVDRGGTLSDIATLNRLVTPDDLFYSSGSLAQRSKEVQRRGTTLDRDIWRWTLWILSPAHLMVTDSQGRRSGFDATTGMTLDEIPGVIYSGTAAGVETITVTDREGLLTDLQLTVTGFATGSYEIEAGSVDSIEPPRQITAGTTAPNKVEVFTIPNPNTTGGVVVVPQPTEQLIYLPLVKR